MSRENIVKSGMYFLKQIQVTFYPPLSSQVF